MTVPVYIASSSMIAQRQRMDVVADNVANVNTAGYKKQSLDFAEMVSRQDSQKVGSFAHHAGSRFVFSQGAFQRTGNSLDVALRGDGFFAKDVGGRTVYTRNGHFSIDAQGLLVTELGEPVLDANGGPITIPADSTNIKITKDGAITNQNGIIANLGVFQFDDPSALRRAGNSGWLAGGAQALLSETPLLEQGYVETSNVNAIKETVTMTNVARRYESTAKMIKSMEELEKSAIQGLSRLP